MLQSDTPEPFMDGISFIQFNEVNPMENEDFVGKLREFI